MSQPQQSAVRNRLLKALSPADFALLQPHLELIATELHQPLIKPNEQVKQLYFPEVGFCSVTTQGSDGRVEIGIIGREGLVGAIPLLLGSDRTPHDHFVQSPGEMLAISTGAFCRAISHSASLHKFLLRFAQVQYVQTAQTAFVNASYQIEVRLARWLLMCHDRLDGDELRLTHDFLSMMLGVQRSSATLAVQALEGHRLIKALRGRMTILNRKAMEELADDGYGLPEAEYARLIEGA
ncbi:Crp/Fnr family transcriptional regulator [Methylorubrum extorquens]|uniref:Cyclic nucleotide-binding protein n=1 Tax=Methylorubrum extorquens (strain CM4 / NCIMB 13688) TaxID=440085 RepID=B7KUH8_METC4|nr:Crp/Fnr family transcriptional regulator [Methylorubrum extorquens]ACK81019.1 cyclic nucleotide-binding protein [Methylorubrum extorquens CM4]ACK84207.1 cyclic nucleotide-binding protein [Methylorubrum extorquens CM4]